MTNEELNVKLYEKMSAELEQFKEELLTMPSEEILRCSYQYNIMQDVVLFMEEHELSDKRAQALLNSTHPLKEVYESWECGETNHMEEIQQTLESGADGLIRDAIMRKNRGRDDEAR